MPFDFYHIAVLFVILAALFFVPTFAWAYLLLSARNRRLRIGAKRHKPEIPKR